MGAIRNWGTEPFYNEKFGETLGARCFAEHHFLTYMATAEPTQLFYDHFRPSPSEGRPYIEAAQWEVIGARRTKETGGLG